LLCEKKNTGGAMMNSKSISTTNNQYNINNNDDIPTSFSALQISSSMFRLIIDCLLVILFAEWMLEYFNARALSLLFLLFLLTR
jgi:hypothetical protein